METVNSRESRHAAPMLIEAAKPPTLPMSLTGVRLKRTRLSRALMAVVLALAGLVVAGFFSAGPADAATCTVNNHCYSIANGIGKGGYVVYYPSCLYAPYGNFATQEMWVGPSSGSQWVETGLIYENHYRIAGDIEARTGRYAFYGSQSVTSWTYHVTDPGVSDGHFTAEVDWQYTNHYLVIIDTPMGNHTFSVANGMYTGTTSFGTESTSAYSNSRVSAMYIDSEVTSASDWRTGVLSPTTEADAPGTFTWVNRYSSFNGGMPC